MKIIKIVKLIEYSIFSPATHLSHTSLSSKENGIIQIYNLIPLFFHFACIVCWGFVVKLMETDEDTSFDGSTRNT